MSQIVITVDTEEQKVSATIDGKDTGEVTSAYVSVYKDYYKPNKTNLSWNISCSNPTDDDDFTSYTHFCSASKVLELVKNQVGGKVKSDINEYFDKKAKR